MVLIVCLSLILLAQLAMCAGGIYVYTKAKTEIADAHSQFVGFFADVGEDGVSAFGSLVNQVAEINAQRLGTTVQASIRGSLGGTMTQMIPALEKEAYAQHPELAIPDILPKSLRKSPAAQIGLQLLMQKLAGGKGSGNGSGAGSSGGQTQFKL